jgi:hypothetical protein
MARFKGYDFVTAKADSVSVDKVNGCLGYPDRYFTSDTEDD